VLLDRTIPEPLRSTYRCDTLRVIANNTFAGLTAPFLLVTARRLGADPLLISLMVAVPFVGHIASLCWAGRMRSRAKKPWVIVPILLARFAFFVPLFTDSLTAYVAMVCFAGLVAVIAEPAYVTLLAGLYPDSARGLAVGRTKFEGFVFMVLATLAAGRLMTGDYDFRWLFPIAAVISMVGQVPFLRVREAPEPDGARPLTAAESARDTHRVLVRDARFRYFEIAFMICGVGLLAAKTIYPLLLVDVLHATNMQVGLLSVGAFLLRMAGYAYWGPWIDRRYPTGAMARGLALRTLVPVGYLAAAAVLPSIWVVALVSLFDGWGLAAQDLGFVNAIIVLAGADRVPRYVSIHKAQNGIRGIVTPFLAVQAKALLGWAWTFGIAAGLLALGAVLMSLVHQAVKAHARRADR